MASAIDFAALVLEERKRARDQRRRRCTDSGSNKEEAKAVASVSATAATAGACDTSWHRTLQPPPFDPAGTRIDSPIEAVHYVPEWLPPEYAEELKAWLLSLPERNNDSDKDDEEAAPTKQSKYPRKNLSDHNFTLRVQYQGSELPTLHARFDGLSRVGLEPAVRVVPACWNDWHALCVRVCGVRATKWCARC